MAMEALFSWWAGNITGLAKPAKIRGGFSIGGGCRDQSLHCPMHQRYLTAGAALLSPASEAQPSFRVKEPTKVLVGDGQL